MLVRVARRHPLTMAQSCLATSFSAVRSATRCAVVVGWIPECLMGGSSGALYTRQWWLDSALVLEFLQGVRSPGTMRMRFRSPVPLPRILVSAFQVGAMRAYREFL